MGEILEFIDRWAGGVTQLAAIASSLILYLLTYRHADKRTIVNRRLRTAFLVIFVVLSAGNLVKFANDQYTHWTEARRKPIEISPAEIPVALGPFKSSRTVTVSNRSESVYHQVWIRVILSGADVRWDQIEIKPRFRLETRQLLPGPGGAVYVSSDVWGLVAMDSTGRKLLCILLRSIPPKTSLGFDVSLPATADTSSNREGTLLLDIWSYSTEPAEFVEREQDGGREAGMTFTPPATLTILGTIAVLSPTPE